ncbi:MAG: N-acetyl sugar amidotransferase [Chitinophagales bacterium]|nr:N-acetyl sugar amidotransferase [Chitinophagales bacterium]
MEFRQCSKCVLDTTVPEIHFDKEGVCNFCHYYDTLANKSVNRSEEVKQKEFQELVSNIKEAGKGKTYDCILGVSGGVDSTYLALFAKQIGLRPLVVHFDNGWNSELAVMNIENIVTKLGYDLHTFVMDWEEFKDLQVAYFKAGVVDIEVPTDQLIFAALNKIAKEQGIKYILSGHNVVTESINPKGWVYKEKFDLVNLKNIHKQFGTMKLRKLPHFGMFDRYIYEAVWGIQTVGLLNYVPYIKSEIKATIQKELDWRDYGGKHYESIFTRFYQGYILPVKFNIDKRKMHLSNLIMSGQINKEVALKELDLPTYPIEDQMADKEYVIKKWEISPEEFEKIMKTPPVPHEHYGTDKGVWYQRKYFLFRAFMYIPVRIGRFLRILHTPKKIKTYF